MVAALCLFLLACFSAPASKPAPCTTARSARIRARVFSSCCCCSSIICYSSPRQQGHCHHAFLPSQAPLWGKSLLLSGDLTPVRQQRPTTTQAGHREHGSVRGKMDASTAGFSTPEMRFACEKLHPNSVVSSAPERKVFLEAPEICRTCGGDKLRGGGGTQIQTGGRRGMESS